MYGLGRKKRGAFSQICEGAPRFVRSVFLIQSFCPGVGEGALADALLFLLFAHVVLHIALGGGVAFFLQFLVEAVELFAEAAAARIDALVAVADDGEALVAFRAAGVGLLFEVAAVTAFAILADEHLAFLGLDLKEELAAFWARGAGHVVVAVLLVGILHILDESAGKVAHVAGESAGAFLSAGDALETFFPLGGEERRGEIVGHDVDELDAFGGWHE